MKTLSARTLRFANLFALVAALIAVCPRMTLAENGGTGGPNLPPPRASYSDGTVIYATSFATQPDGSTTYSTATVTWANGTSWSGAWANVSTSGVILFSDGTMGHI
jgi:hypothetical protein